MEGTKIVFFIRARFHDSIMSRCWRPNGRPYGSCIEYTNWFNKSFKISLQEYRTKIHEIQLECLNKISSRIIINKTDAVVFNLPGWALPYLKIQEQVFDELLSLNDDDVLIPLDDDDWLSPEIKNINFAPKKLTIWNCFSINTNGKNLLYYKCNEELPEELNSDHEQRATKLLSNCQAFSAYSIKRVIRADKDAASLFLQRHVLPRILIRKKEYKELFDGETIFEKRYAVYVRHLGNKTLYSNIEDGTDSLRNYYLKNMKNYTNFLKDELISNFPESYKWSIPYYTKLQNLNSELCNSWIGD